MKKLLVLLTVLSSLSLYANEKVQLVEASAKTSDLLYKALASKCEQMIVGNSASAGAIDVISVDVKSKPISIGRDASEQLYEKSYVGKAFCQLY